MTYQRIAPLSEQERGLGRPELGGLMALWAEREVDLRESGSRPEFIERLVREFSIETGLIERLYVWDRGLTETLIEFGIDAAVIRQGSSLDRAAAARASALIDDQRQALEGVFEMVRGARPLNEHSIRGLHELLTRNQPTTEARTGVGQGVDVELIHGRYKEKPNNPRRADGTVHEYCPPELTQEQMERLVRWYEELGSDAPADVGAAWLHHRFTQIHPFQDGNGRVARLLASLVFLKAGGLPLVLRLGDRVRYISALEAADSGDLGPLVELFGERQSVALRSALAGPVSTGRDVSEILSEAEKKLRGRSPDSRELLRAKEIAETLRSRAGTRLSELAGAVRLMVQRARPDEPGSIEATQTGWSAGSRKADRFAGPIREAASVKDYEPDVQKHVAFAALSIRSTTGSEFLFVVGYHALARMPGVLAATAFTMRSSDPNSPSANPDPVSDSPFVLTYQDDEAASIRRHEQWLESAAARALERWEETL